MLHLQALEALPSPSPSPAMAPKHKISPEVAATCRFHDAGFRGHAVYRHDVIGPCVDLA